MVDIKYLVVLYMVDAGGWVGRWVIALRPYHPGASYYGDRSLFGLIRRKYNVPKAIFFCWFQSAEDA